MVEIPHIKNTKRRALTQPGTVGGKIARNRIVVGPLCTMYAAPDGSTTSQLIEYYRARARGGAAIVIIELTFIDDIASRSFHAQPGAQSDMMIPGLSELAEAIKEGGYFSPHVQEAVDKIHNAMGELQKLTLRHLADMQAILSEDQNKKLEEKVVEQLYRNAGK